MQTLHGIRISDRVAVDHDLMSDTYIGRFDGEVVTGRCRSGAVAVRMVQDWLENRAKQRELDKAHAARDEAEQQRCTDAAFLNMLADKLGVDAYELDELIEVVKRRITS